MTLPFWFKAALAAVILSIIGGACWFVYASIYDRGYNAAMAKWAEASIKASAAARAKEQALTKKLQEAQDAAIQREKKLLADADAARTAAGSLRNDLAEFRRQLPSLTREAVERYADAASVVFGECTAEYQRLAEQADRIDSDRQKLEDAWPR